MCHSPGRASSFLDRLFEGLKQRGEEDPQKWSDRDRLLMITGSYNEAECVESRLQLNYRRFEHPDTIATLRRDNAPAELRGIRRGKIQTLKDTPIRLLTAPLMGLERGHNILNNQDKAAFGAALFLNRPMPVPDDWQSTVQQLNAWALDNQENSTLYEAAKLRGETVTLTKVEDLFYRFAVAQMLDLNCRAMSFQQLTKEEKRVLCWTQFVSIWQIIGRLVRGGVPCIVHFMDRQFAPKSADGDMDSERTSLLVGIIKELEPYVEGEGKRPYEKTLAESLYGAFLNALKKMKQQGHLHYD